MKLLSLRSLVTLFALTATVVGTTACESDDARVIGGTIAIVAGAIAIDRALDDRPTCRGGYVQQCREIRDRWGRLHRSCSRVWDSCASRYSTAGFSPAVGSALALSAPSAAVNDIASKYGLPLESAARLTTVLQSAAGGDVQALSAMGLSSDEMRRVATYKLPTNQALDQIAQSLALSREMTIGLVEQLMTETRAQMADINSPAWAACQATGKWKTDANGGTCKSTAWTGCSPETGAAMCAAL